MRVKKNVFLILSLGFVLILNLYVRSFPVYFPQLKTQAKNIIENSIQQGTMAEVYKKFPQFYPLAKDEIKKSKMVEYKRLNKKTIDAEIRKLYLKLKDRHQDDSGQTYIMELDCWHWARYVQNIVRQGHPGDRVISGKQWDMFMLAPTGEAIKWDDFLYYFSAILYKTFFMFFKIPVFVFVFYLPLFFTAIFMITLYLVSFRYGKNLGAIASCLFIGLAPVIIPRSTVGWFDKDVLNLLFPVAIFGIYSSVFNTDSQKKRFLWILFSSFLVGLFSFSWTHWWFIFFIIIFYEFLTVVYLGLSNIFFGHTEWVSFKRHLLFLISFSFLSMLFVFLMAGTEPLVELYNQTTEALRFNKPIMPSIWPNVYSTVGEMRNTNVAEIMRSIGGSKGGWFFTASLLCMSGLLVRALWDKKYAPFKRASISILAVWFASMFFATTRGVRFIVFLTIPLGISLGWAINDVYAYFREKRNFFGIFLTAAFFIVFCVVSIQNGYGSATYCYPLMTDTWYKMLNLIKEKSPEDAIINSWWDYGDWFKVVANRRVIFDGQSQGTPQAYWMAKALLTDDENEAISILRMLNNGGNEAFDVIDGEIKNELRSAILLEGILAISPERAQATLLKFLPPQAVDEVMRILFATPSKACFVVDDSMPFKIGAISYLGNWDFSRVYMAQNFNKQEKAQIIEYLKSFGRDEQELQRFYQEVFLISTKNLNEWLSHRLQFYSGTMDGHEKGGVIYFENGFAYNPGDSSLRSNNGQIPRSLFLQVDGNIIEQVFPNANIGCSLLIYQTQPGVYKSVMLDRELGKSMFVRLYFLKGKGLRHFTPFIDAEEGNSYIRVFGIAW